ASKPARSTAASSATATGLSRNAFWLYQRDKSVPPVQPETHGGQADGVELELEPELDELEPGALEPSPMPGQPPPPGPPRRPAWFTASVTCVARSALIWSAWSCVSRPDDTSSARCCCASATSASMTVCGSTPWALATSAID